MQGVCPDSQNEDGLTALLQVISPIECIELIPSGYLGMQLSIPYGSNGRFRYLNLICNLCDVGDIYFFLPSSVVGY